MWWLIWMLMLLIPIMYILWKKKGPLSTANGAIIMALGIMNIGVFQRVQVIKEGSTILQLMLVLLLVGAFVYDACKYKDFWRIHFEHPIKSFAIGTWVAGLSVTTISIMRGLPQLKEFAIILLLFVFIIYLFYLALVVRNYHIILREQSLLYSTHGIVLLSCVSTQSLVIAGTTVFKDIFPIQLLLTLFMVGFLFYLLGIFWIVRNIVRNKQFSLTKDWNNTNCIIHGALSITGLASIKLGIVPTSVSSLIWLTVVVIFFLVEIIECIRAYKRIKTYGWRKGIFVYNTSQWARNFTFGMFLVFSQRLTLDHEIWVYSFLLSIKQSMLSVFSIIIIILFLIQSTLFFANQVPNRLPVTNRNLTN